MHDPRQSWACQVAVWLAFPQTGSASNPSAPAPFPALKAPDTRGGSWLWTGAKAGDSAVLSVDTTHGAQSLTLVSACGKLLLSAPLRPSSSAFALLPQRHGGGSAGRGWPQHELAISLMHETSGEPRAFTFLCRFSSAAHAVACAAALKGSLKAQPPLVLKTQPQPPGPRSRAGASSAAAEELLLRAVASDPERCGLAWWGDDFRQAVDEAQTQWAEAALPEKQS